MAELMDGFLFHFAESQALADDIMSLMSFTVSPLALRSKERTGAIGV